MNLDLLINKVVEYLGVSASEKDFAFKMFVNQLAENLEVNEALKIERLGVFQLKSEISDRAKTPRNVLIFSPFTEKLSRETRSLYLTIDVSVPKSATIDFDESLFSLGVNKPTIPVIENEKYQSDSYLILQKLIENKIDDLLANSERIRNFNLVGEYLSGAKVPAEKKIMPDAEDLSTDKKEEEIPFKRITHLDKFTFEEEPDNQTSADITAEKDEEENLLNEGQYAPSETGKEFINEDTDSIFEAMLKESMEDTPVNEEYSENEMKNEKADDSFRSEKKDAEKIEWDWGDELKEEFFAEDEFVENDNQSKEKTITEKPLKIREPVLIEESNEKEDLFEQMKGSYSEDFEEVEEEKIMEEKPKKPVEQPLKQSAVEPEKKNEKESAKSKSHKKTLPQPAEKFTHKKSGGFGKVFWIIFALFVLVTAGGVYYLFFMKEGSVQIVTDAAGDTAIYNGIEKLQEPVIKTGEQTPALSTEIDSTNIALENEDSLFAKILEEKKTGEEKTTDSKTAETKTPDTKNTGTKPDNSKPVDTKKETDKEKAETGLIRSSANERQIANLIFSDGKKFNVQVSSWKQKYKAESEVNRLKALGHDAFIVEAYLPNLGGTWYRVRIGYFKSSTEAADFLSKRNF